MEPRPPAPSNPSPPPMAEAIPEIGETASGSHTSAATPSSNAIPAPPREPQAGDIIGPYRIRGELGRGGMAVVYRAEEAELSRDVALKVLLPATTTLDPQAKARFTREARAQAKFTHDHVITIYRVGEADGMSYIAMPLLKGQTLSAALNENRRPPVTEVLRIGAEIAEALAAAHAAGLVHRDIKPGNIWLEAPKRWVKILDFGLARAPEATDAQLTQAGKVVGTPAYMSPEQAAGKPIDHRTDLFSLGVVLYQMATGHKPFTGETGINVMAAILMSEPVSPSKLAPDLPPTLAALIMRLLSKNPAGRPQTAAHVVVELEAIRRLLIAPPVVVVSAPVPAAPAADPWADLEATEREETPAPAAKSSPRHARPTRDEPEPRRRAPAREEPEPRARRSSRDEPGPRSFKWLWIGGGVAGLVLLGGLVWLAVLAVSPKKPDGKDSGKPPVVVAPPVVAPKPAVVDDRAAAEILLKKAKLHLLLDGTQELDVAANGALPNGRITILEIDFGEEPGLNGFYVNSTFLPALAALKSLTGIHMLKWQMDLSADNVRQLAAMPLANTLKRLDARTELTSASVTELKKFKSLEDAAFFAPEANDALFGRLVQTLPNMDTLTLFSVDKRPELTDEGWETIGKLPLVSFTMVRCPSAADAFRVLSAKGVAPRLGVPRLEFQTCPRFDDEALRELSERPTDLKTLVLRGTGITDAGLLHLVGVKSLKTLDLKLCNVTEEGVKALRTARPNNLQVLWDEKTVELKKK